MTDQAQSSAAPFWKRVRALAHLAYPQSAVGAVVTSAAPRLYPVTLDLSCPVHGVVQRMTVTNLAAQVQWTLMYQGQHEADHNCTLILETLVPTDA